MSSIKWQSHTDVEQERISCFGRFSFATFGLDLISIKVLRFAIGLCLLGTLGYYLLDAKAWFSDSGVLPRRILLDSDYLQSFLPVYMMRGEAWFVYAMLILEIFLCIAWLKFPENKFLLLLNWILLSALHSRNFLILHSGDVLLRMILFWLLFIPGDQALANKNRILSIGTVGLLFQMFFVYFGSGVAKWNEHWLQNADAVTFALSLEDFSHWLGPYLKQYQGLCRFLSRTTVMFEIVAPIVYLSAGRFLKVRIVIPLLFIAFHLGLAACLRIGNFPFICMALWLGLLPGCLWEAIFQKIKPFISEKINLFGLNRRFCVCPIHSTYSSVLPFHIIGFIALMTCFFHNLEQYFSDVYKPRFPIPFVVEMLRLDQRWTMFAPHPPTDSGWYVIEIEWRDGAKIDLLTGESPVDGRPLNVPALYPNYVWTKYLANLWYRDFDQYRPYYLQYLCRENIRDGSMPKKIQMIFMEHPTLSPQMLTKKVLKIQYCS